MRYKIPMIGFGIVLMTIASAVGAGCLFPASSHLAEQSYDPLQPLTVRIESLPSCHLGDLDLIKADIALRGESRLLLTVESIGDANEVTVPTAVELSHADIEDGYEIAFKLPRSTETALAFSICTDAEHQQRCLGKKLLDLNALETALRRTLRSPTAYPMHDKVFFFAPLFVTKGKVATIQRPLQSRNDFAALHREVNSSLYIDERLTVEALPTIERFSTSLQSVPAELGPNSILLRLPTFVPAACTT